MLIENQRRTERATAGFSSIMDLETASRDSFSENEKSRPDIEYQDGPD